MAAKELFQGVNIPVPAHTRVPRAECRFQSSLPL